MDNKEIICKLWWPKTLLPPNSPDTGVFLFGWCFDTALDSIDVVVAVGASKNADFRSDPLDSFCHINGKMPIPLQDCSPISLLGSYGLACNGENSRKISHQMKDTRFGDSNEIPCHIGIIKNEVSYINSHNNEKHNKTDILLSHEKTDVNHFGISKSHRHNFKILFEHHKKSSIQNGSWIELISVNQKSFPERTNWYPRLHSLYQKGKLLFVRHLHVIVYDPPTFCSHHFSLTTWNCWMQERTSLRKPCRFVGPQNKNPLPDFETVILSLNCCNAVREGLEGCLTMGNSCSRTKIRYRLAAITWHIIADFVASISVMIYIILQLCHSFVVCSSQSFIFMTCARLFHHAFINVQIRCTQLQYWSVFLLGSGFSYHPNIEYLHKAAVKKHAILFSIVVDAIMGNIVGLLLWNNLEAIHLWVSAVSSHITNYLLRSGCVWLMGVPAGFKLNTELAELIGMISLNAIQIWSTLSSFMNLVFGCAFIGLALSGILFGLTTSAAIFIDLLKIATMHISALHWLISFLYSQQIQALTSLWRLFRGQKWNPLRKRLDSFDYTVNEHVVGSLLFIPVLLLLPTTTIFYIFFTIMNSTINLFCVTVEITISLLHATPYAELFLWIFTKGRFPSGIWFEVVKSGKILNDPSACSVTSVIRSSMHDRSDQINTSEQTNSIFFLHSNFANIGQILDPFIGKVFSGFSFSFIQKKIYGMLSGQRMTDSLRIHLPPTLPWINLSFREYWRVCHDAVLACDSS